MDANFNTGGNEFLFFSATTTCVSIFTGYWRIYPQQQQQQQQRQRQQQHSNNYSSGHHHAKIAMSSRKEYTRLSTFAADEDDGRRHMHCWDIATRQRRARWPGIWIGPSHAAIYFHARVVLPARRGASSIINTAIMIIVIVVVVFIIIIIHCRHSTTRI